MANSGRKLKRHRTLPEEKVREIHDAFAAFDMHDNGYLEYSEFKSALRALGFKVTKVDALKMIETYDKSKRSRISQQDFRDIATEMMLQQDPKEDTIAAFQLFLEYCPNTDKISVQHLRRIAQELGEKVTEEELQSMIDEFDVDGDGLINEEEFVCLMLNNAHI